MKTRKVGVGDPELAVVGSIHGDEPCGKKAIEKFLDSEYEVQKPIKFLIANEKALEQNKRFLEADLNRSFPGDPESEKHEERLAAKIVDELEGLKILDIHSTRSQPTPYAAFGGMDDRTLDVVSSAGMKKACYFPEGSGSLNSVVSGSVVEVGPQGTETAEKQAYEVLINFLAAEGIIDADYEKTDPLIVEKYETVSGGDWEFKATNFEKVEPGEVFAEHGTTQLTSTEGFYPVLMSTNGYELILGHKARKLGKASELQD
ncbi:succinylglutamate desuccinylase/aspartoacylase family protein [Candidatus Nanohalococcus occultus]|uniref:succinylglutamate desuccinylase/aspartoacylase domain-containing protein n=1 Tax=Candidatus Nanohalococcus occultus TaxID=2978047 RepID=UPI0039E0FB67